MHLLNSLTDTKTTWLCKKPSCPLDQLNTAMLAKYLQRRPKCFLAFSTFLQYHFCLSRLCGSLSKLYMPAGKRGVKLDRKRLNCIDQPPINLSLGRQTRKEDPVISSHQVEPTFWPIYQSACQILNQSTNAMWPRCHCRLGNKHGVTGPWDPVSWIKNHNGFSLPIKVSINCFQLGLIWSIWLWIILSFQSEIIRFTFSVGMNLRNISKTLRLLTLDAARICLSRL